MANTQKEMHRATPEYIWQAFSHGAEWIGNICQLKSRSVADHPHCLSREQLLWFIESAPRNGMSVCDLMARFTLNTRAWATDDGIFYIPDGTVEGIFPGSECYGAILPDGSTHT